MKLSKSPGVAETLDLSRSLILLEKTTLDREAAEETLGCILKSADDLAKVRSEGTRKTTFPVQRVREGVAGVAGVQEFRSAGVQESGLNRD